MELTCKWLYDGISSATHGAIHIMTKRLVWNFEINDKNPLTLPTPSIHESAERWEARFFWPETAIICLNGLDDRFLALSSYQAKHRQDTYCLLPDTDYNLKIRRQQLLYKPALSRTPLMIAYGKKLNLEEQINDFNAQTLLQRTQQAGHRIDVEKEALIYRFKTEPTAKLELARLSVADSIWFSASIESRSSLLVESIGQQMLGEQASCDYVTFLKRFL